MFGFEIKIFLLPLGNPYLPLLILFWVATEGVFMIDYEWSVVVFKCKSGKTLDILVDFYRFVERLVGIKSVHFLIRDRVDDDVVLSFRMLVELEEKTHVEETIALELRDLLPEEPFAINPEPTHPLHEYGAWPWRERINKDGSEKFTIFCSYLSQLSRMIVDMIEKQYFDSKERIEMARMACSMLGCTEYGLLSTTGMQVGYYDRLIDQYHPYLSTPFTKEAK